MPLPVDLPGPSTRRVAVRVTSDALRQVRGGHPWVYDASVTSAGEGAPGDLAVVFDAHRRFAAVGLWDPASPIRVKVLHHGDPIVIDEAFWRHRVATALHLRAGLDGSPGTDGYRCINGEGDGLPGLILDRYAATYVLKLYSPAWVPHLPVLVPILADLLRPHALVLRVSRSTVAVLPAGLREGDALIGEAPTEPVLFEENGLTLEADVGHGQKTGAFLDQRDNRALLRTMSGGATVLDVFACTGGFSVAAAAGGATAVHSVDLSAPALAAAQRNLRRNHDHPAVRRARHEITVGDAFEVLSAMASRGERFGVVVIDPPSFAQRQANVERGLGAYGRLTRSALRVLGPGGLLLQASCSSRIPADAFFAAVFGAAAAENRRLDEVTRTGHAVDHPAGFREGHYLKAIFARVR